MSAAPETTPSPRAIRIVIFLLPSEPFLFILSAYLYSVCPTVNRCPHTKPRAPANSFSTPVTVAYFFSVSRRVQSMSEDVRI